MTRINLTMTVDIPENENIEEEIWDIISRTQHEFSYYDCEVSQDTSEAPEFVKSDKIQYRFVEFTFSIAAMGKDEEDLVSFALDELETDHYEIFKDILRNPQHAKIGEVIDEAEVSDYFLLPEEE